MTWMRPSALILGNSGVLNSNKAVCILKQNENNLFRGFCGVKISHVIGYIAINIPDIF